MFSHSVKLIVGFAAMFITLRDHVLTQEAAGLERPFVFTESRDAEVLLEVDPSVSLCQQELTQFLRLPGGESAVVSIGFLEVNDGPLPTWQTFPDRKPDQTLPVGESAGRQPVAIDQREDPLKRGQLVATILARERRFLGRPAMKERDHRVLTGRITQIQEPKIESCALPTAGHFPPMLAESRMEEVLPFFDGVHVIVVISV